MQRAPQPIYVAVLLSAMVASFLAFQSCGTDGDDATVPQGSADAGAIAAGPSAVTLPTGTAASFPAGAIPAGSSLTVVPTAPPAEFAALTELSVASGAVEVTATGPSGEALASPAAPGSIVLFLDASPAALALHDIGVKAADLCALGLTSDGKKLVYRHASLAAVDLAAKTATFRSPWFGTFQIVYCGDEALPGFAEATATGIVGEPPLAPEPPESPTAAATLACVNTTSTCLLYAGSVYQLEALGANCADGGGDRGADCSRSDSFGVCVAQAGTTNEIATFFYAAAGADPATEEASCLKSGSQFMPAAAYKASKKSAQRAPTIVETASGEGFACASAGSCLAYVGTIFAGQKEVTEAACTSTLQGKLVAYDACPAADLVGVCVRHRGTVQETAQYYYAASGTTAETLTGICAESGAEKLGAEYVPTAPAAQAAIVVQE